jgi:hypothetical protein
VPIDGDAIVGKVAAGSVPVPSPAQMQIPPPKSHDEFEDIVVSSLKCRWRTSDVQRNGRNGQGQNGVDIYGSDDLQRPTGVQCKLVIHGGFSRCELEVATAEAEAFVPPLSSLFVATTTPRDAALQQAVRLNSKARVEAGKFAVGLLFWDDIVADLLADDDAMRLHFPSLAPSSATPAPAWAKEHTLVARIRWYLLGSLHRTLMRESGAWTTWSAGVGYAFGADDLVREADWLRQRGLVDARCPPTVCSWRSSPRRAGTSCRSTGSSPSAATWLWSEGRTSLRYAARTAHR